MPLQSGRAPAGWGRERRRRAGGAWSLDRWRLGTNSYAGSRSEWPKLQAGRDSCRRHMSCVGSSLCPKQAQCLQEADDRQERQWNRDTLLAVHSRAIAGLGERMPHDGRVVWERDARATCAKRHFEVSIQRFASGCPEDQSYNKQNFAGPSVSAGKIHQ